MFDIGFAELLVVGVLGLIVLGPERLPKAARTLGLLLGRVRRTMSGIQQEIEREVRDQELQEKLKDSEYRFMSKEDQARQLAQEQQDHDAFEQIQPASENSIAPDTITNDQKQNPSDTETNTDSQQHDPSAKKENG